MFYLGNMLKPHETHTLRKFQARLHLYCRIYIIYIYIYYTVGFIYIYIYCRIIYIITIPVV